MYTKEPELRAREDSEDDDEIALLATRVFLRREQRDCEREAAALFTGWKKQLSENFSLNSYLLPRNFCVFCFVLQKKLLTTKTSTFGLFGYLVQTTFTLS